LPAPKKAGFLVLCKPEKSGFFCIMKKQKIADYLYESNNEFEIPNLLLEKQAG